MATVGIVGGVGPMAAAHFYARLIDLTPAATDQDHVGVVLIADPRVPSRVDHLLGRGPTPSPVLVEVARRLERAGAGLIVIPSVTTHAYRVEMAAAVGIPVLDAVAALGEELERRTIQRPAILATTATAQLRLLDRGFGHGVRPIYPDEATQADVMAVILAIKAGEPAPPLAAGLTELLGRPWANGADAVILACTELPVIAAFLRLATPVLDVTDVVAAATLAAVRAMEKGVPIRLD